MTKAAKTATAFWVVVRADLIRIYNACHACFPCRQNMTAGQRWPGKDK